MTCDPETLDLTTDVSRYFDDAVQTALVERSVETTDAARTYLVGLLVDYARPGELADEALSRPLTLMLHEALQEVGHERFHRLQAVGDTVLYTTGFFGDHLCRRGVQLDYVQHLGARAYGHAGAMLRRHVETCETDVFGELAENFADFVALVRHVADQALASSAHTDRALVGVYERWLQTGSSALARTLLEHGMTPTTGQGLVH